MQPLNNITLFPQKNQGVTSSMGAVEKITSLHYWMKWKPYMYGFKIFEILLLHPKKLKAPPMLMKLISNSNQSLHFSEVICLTFPTLPHNLPHSQNHGNPLQGLFFDSEGYRNSEFSSYWKQKPCALEIWLWTVNSIDHLHSYCLSQNWEAAEKQAKISF